MANRVRTLMEILAGVKRILYLVRVDGAKNRPLFGFRECVFIPNDTTNHLCAFGQGLTEAPNSGQANDRPRICQNMQ